MKPLHFARRRLVCFIYIVCQCITKMFRPSKGCSSWFFYVLFGGFWMRPRALTLLGTIAKKLAQCIVVLFLLSLAVFYMARLAPGDPLRSYYGESVERMSPRERETAIHSLGLDQPIYKQYGIWLQNAFGRRLGHFL